MCLSSVCLYDVYYYFVEKGLQKAKNATAVLFGDKKALLRLSGLFVTNADIVARGECILQHF